MKGGSSREREWAAARGWVDLESGPVCGVGDQEAEAVGRGLWDCMQPEVLRGTPAGAQLIYQKLTEGPSPRGHSQPCRRGPAERLCTKTWHLSGND